MDTIKTIENMVSALAAFEFDQSNENFFVLKHAIKALEEALAKQEQKRQQNCGTSYCSCIECVMDEQEQGEPVAWVDLLKDAEQIVKDKFLYKRFIDGTPLANDIPCWMADFAQQYTTPQQRKPLTDKMIFVAARVMNDRQADACNVDRDDQWKIYGQDFIDDARAMLEAANGIKE